MSNIKQEPLDIKVEIHYAYEDDGQNGNLIDKDCKGTVTDATKFKEHRTEEEIAATSVDVISIIKEEQNEYIRDKDVFTNDASIYKCLMCFKTFITKRRLCKHITFYHSIKEKTPYDCKICHKRFASKYNCSRHTYSHTDEGESPVSALYISRDNIQGEVERSTNKKQKHFCIYCFKSISNFARHITTVHKLEPKVKKCNSLAKGSKLRISILEDLRNNGNYLHNTDAKYNNNTLYVARRPRKDAPNKFDDFLPCCICKKMFAKLSLRKHLKQHGQMNKTGSMHSVVAAKKISGRIHYKASDVLKKIVFPVLRLTEAVMIARFDELIIMYANKLCVKYTDQRSHGIIRCEIRVLGKLMLEIKRLDPSIKNLSDALTPHYYDTVLNAVKAVGRFNEQDGSYAAPTIVLNLKTTVKKLCNVLILQCINTADRVRKTNLEEFKTLLNSDLDTAINKLPFANLELTTCRNTTNLPQTDDIKTLTTFIETLQAKCYIELSSIFTDIVWEELGSSTLIYLHVFNRMRDGELERMKISDLDTAETLPNEESNHVTVNIRGKSGRTVLVFIPTFSHNCIKIFISYRIRAGVQQDNPFIFGLPGGGVVHTRMRACTYLRKYAKKCNATDVRLLRGMKLRKNSSALSKERDLDQQLVSHLSNDLGQSETIHDEFYRLPIEITEIKVMPAILEQTFDISNLDEEKKLMPRIEETIKTVEPSTPESDESNNDMDFDAAASDDETDGSDDIEEDRQMIKRCRWTTLEINTASDVFRKNLQTGIIPSAKGCQKVIVTHKPIFDNRTDVQLKLWVYNQINKAKIKTTTPKKKKLMPRIEENPKIVELSTPESDDSINDKDFDAPASADEADGSNDIEEDRQMIKRCRWTTLEKDTASDVFRKNLQTGILPSAKACQKVILTKQPIFDNRTAVQLKLWVHNQINKAKTKTTTPKKKKLMPRLEETTKTVEPSTTQSDESNNDMDFDAAASDDETDRSNDIEEDRQMIKRCRWTTPERDTASDVFRRNLQTGILPSAKACQKVIVTNKPIFDNRTDVQLKLWVHNQINKAKTKTTTPKKSTKDNRLPWTTPEKTAIRQIFAENLKNGKLPTNAECSKVVKENTCLRKRTGTSLQTWIRRSF